MKSSNFVSLLKDLKSGRACFCGVFPTALFCLVFFIGCAFITQDHKEKLLKWGFQDSKFYACENTCRPPGSESLPKGIISKTSNLERRPLWGSPKNNVNSSKNLLAVAVGIKQKKMVDKIVRKFLSSDFVVMLFHYDGIVDEWKDLGWSDSVIHVSAVNQTKWWFAKRFLHPDIVAEYSYIFLWDEDLGVEDFNPERYLLIAKDEGLEISQPALDAGKSEVHHQITARAWRSNVHRRTYKSGDNGSECNGNSKAPPCTGWIEVMAPVFSNAAWRCVWYMIQNDFIHAWGLDMQLGYCAQGDRTINVGVVDAEYIVHYGLPTLGESGNETILAANGNTSEIKNVTSFKTNSSSSSSLINYRVEVRRESYREYKAFKRRWSKAAAEDECWIDPYAELVEQNVL